MKIFIDEAGIFIPSKKKKWSISCVGALCIPDQLVDEIFKGFEELKSAWNIKGEAKGRKINESEISDLIKYLLQFDVFFELVAIDMQMHRDKEVTHHRMMQAKALTENLTEEHKGPLVKSIKDAQEEYRRLQNQLYVQGVCTTELLDSVLRKSTLYYSQRIPETLNSFSWEIDAKHEKTTPYEELWSKFLMPSLQSKSFKNPLIQLRAETANYEYFDKFCDVSDAPPKHLRKAISTNSEPFYYINIHEIFGKYVFFQQSHKNIGIQLADILTTAARRAMNGNLKFQGWQSIGKLMLQSARGSSTIKLIGLGHRSTVQYAGQNPPYWQVIPLADKTCKNMLLTY